MAEEVEVEIIEEKHISNVEAYRILKEAIEKIKEYEGSVPPFLVKTLTYLSKSSKLTPEEAESLKNTLLKYGLKEETAIMIVNICPQTLDELRTLLELEEKYIDTETAEEILKMVKSYCREE